MCMTSTNLKDSLANRTFARELGPNSISNHVVNDDRVLGWICKRDEVVKHAKSETFLWLINFLTLSIRIGKLFDGWDIFRSSI